MKRLVGWLLVEWDWKRVLVASFAFVLIWLAVAYWLNSIIPGYGPDLSKRPYEFWLVEASAGPKAFVCVMLEEALFRFAPLRLSIFIFYKSWIILLVTLGASFVFAISHGVGYHYTASHFVFGILLCFLFLKCGGCQKNNWWGAAKALLATTATHYLSNLGIVTLWWFISRR